MEIFLVTAPGLETVLAEEARAAGFADPVAAPGGVTTSGLWPDVWRANLCLRGASRVLVRIGAFRALHPAQLHKRASKFPWRDTLRVDVPVRVEATCRKSRIYHAGAARERIVKALTEQGIPTASDAPVTLKIRIEDDLCTISIDSSGEGLHKRGHKQAVGKAPMRETLAALFLRAAGYRGTEPVLDPMCGSGTFPIEAAEIALGLAPGRSRGFAFEHLVPFDPHHWADMKATTRAATDQRFFGSDRDAGAVSASRANADRAGVAAVTGFTQSAVSDLQRPDGPPGLVVVNPPYGARIGNRKLLYAVHDTLGKTLRSRFRGWRVALVTSDAGLARTTGLPWQAPGPFVAHGGLRVRLYQTSPLGQADKNRA